MAYHKTSVEIDLDALHEAETNLGTSGVKQTVNAALRAVNRKAALAAAADYVLSGKLDVPNEETWAAWRAPRS